MSVDREELITRLQRFPDRLKRLVKQQPEDLLCEAGTGGDWGAVEILAYMRDWEDVLLDWVDHVLTEENPTLEEYDTDLWAIERDYASEKPDAAVDAFVERRVKLLEQLPGLEDEAWLRPAQHQNGDSVNLEDLIVELDRHDQSNMKTLREILL